MNSTKIRRAHLRRNLLHIHKASETNLFRVLVRYFRRQSDEIILQVESEVLSAELAFPDADGATEELIEVARPPLLRSTNLSAGEELPDFLLADIPKRVQLGIDAAITDTLAQPCWAHVQTESRRNSGSPPPSQRAIVC